MSDEERLQELEAAFVAQRALVRSLRKVDRRDPALEAERLKLHAARVAFERLYRRVRRTNNGAGYVPPAFLTDDELDDLRARLLATRLLRLPDTAFLTDRIGVMPKGESECAVAAYNALDALLTEIEHHRAKDET